MLGVVNIAGDVNLEETTLISSIAIRGSAVANNVVYTASVMTNFPFRVIGFCNVTEATAGTWATAPSTVQGTGGMALAAISSLNCVEVQQALCTSIELPTTISMVLIAGILSSVKSIWFAGAIPAFGMRSLLENFMPAIFSICGHFLLFFSDMLIAMHP